jgi:hypothetical protein
LHRFFIDPYASTALPQLMAQLRLHRDNLRDPFTRPPRSKEQLYVRGGRWAGGGAGWGLGGTPWPVGCVHVCVARGRRLRPLRGSATPRPPPLSPLTLGQQWLQPPSLHPVDAAMLHHPRPRPVQLRMLPQVAGLGAWPVRGSHSMFHTHPRAMVPLPTHLPAVLCLPAGAWKPTS